MHDKILGGGRHRETSVLLGTCLRLLIRGRVYGVPGICKHYIYGTPRCLPLSGIADSTIMKYSLIAGLLAVAGTNGKPTSHIESESINVETLRTVPQGWTAIGAPAGHRKLPFRIAIRSVRSVLMRLHN